MSFDPLAPKYPFYTPYQFAGNSPIVFIDLDGLERALPKTRKDYKRNQLYTKKTQKEIDRRKNGKRPRFDIIPLKNTLKTRVISGQTGYKFLNGDQTPREVSEENIEKRKPFVRNRDFAESFEGRKGNFSDVTNIFDGDVVIPKDGVVEEATLNIKIEVLGDSGPQTVRVKQGTFELGPMGEENLLSSGNMVLEKKSFTESLELTIPLKGINPNTSFSLEFEGIETSKLKVSGSIKLKGTEPDKN